MPENLTAENVLEEHWPNRPWPIGLKTDTMILKMMKIHAKNTLQDFAKSISEIKPINGDYKETLEIIQNLSLLILTK